MNLPRIIVARDCDSSQTDAKTMRSAHKSLEFENNEKKFTFFNSFPYLIDEFLPATACADPVIVWILLPKIDCRQHVANVKKIVNVIITNPRVMKNFANFHCNG